MKGHQRKKKVNFTHHKEIGVTDEQALFVCRVQETFKLTSWSAAVRFLIDQHSTLFLDKMVRAQTRVIDETMFNETMDRVGQDVKHLSLQVQRLGLNLNQSVKLANSGQIANIEPSLLIEMKQQLAETSKEVDRLRSQIKDFC